MTHPYLSGAPRPRILAHRGLVPVGSPEMVENSFAAIAAAHAAGAVYVESDCHLTRDGEVVLFHDDDLSRVAGDPRLVRDVTLRELEDLMADRGGLASFEQALQSFPDVRFNIDVKADAAAEPAGRLAASAAERVLLTSFSERRRRTALAAAGRARPTLLPATSAGATLVARVAAAAVTGSRRLVDRTLAGIDALQVPEYQNRIRVVTPRFLDAVHGAGVEVHVWTVNEESDMRRLIGMGVDGLVTDRADLALRILGPGR
ncbi:glycerophosphoryl diester phosphodiesterase [Microbacterium sp. SORGH_AS428]|uniref:glycerophosphodiester phosphodiesterase family protein n=1 Tax=Microbacterium sp. SORGH_AS_0428 TaxID=3041788 RepID=UPI0028586D8D|nr:glycerophosphodiester phosphodiesterase family protein [Microbacterium sp. SORGH_AS_0428]MDR6198379.1 glycerophosphoryl diester phosphodiesterase [Microbacterium sp. SORGH_AS_0428]